MQYRHQRRIIPSPSKKLANVLIYVPLIIMSIIFIYPLYQVLVVSVSDPRIVMQNNAIMLIPKGFQLEAYKIVLGNRNISIGFQNTLYYMVLGTAFQYLITILSAFLLSKPKVMFKKAIVFYFVFTMYFSGGLIPYFLLINNLGLMNSRLVLIIPFGVNVWNIIIMRTQFKNFPWSLSEAAYIDGASDFWILFKIYVPLSGAVTAVLVLFSAVTYWNMWFEPMMFLTERSKYPLQSMLREILIDSENVIVGAGRTQVKVDVSRSYYFEILVKYANIIISTVPILVVYPFMQKYFVKGVMIGSLKE